MNENLFFAALGTIPHVLVQILLIVRVLLRPNREAASRIAWIVVILALPILGIVTYLLLGETSIGRKRVARMRNVISQLPTIASIGGTETTDPHEDIPEHYAHLFRAGKTVNGFEPVGGNRASLMHDSNTGIDSIVADIDEAANSVHLLFYIWLSDKNGLKVVEALKRAAVRGVTCRAMADDLGSRAMIGSRYWGEMESAGIHLGRALQIGNPLLRPFRGRIDLRNHRKIVVIDNCITYCGSQNCADPEFRVKPKFAPWVDALMRFEGPIVRQNQFLFASDWEADTGENINHLLTEPYAQVEPGFPAQVIGTGPTVRNSAMPEIFETLIYSARRKLIISTPYYVPVEPMQAALCASARRGVDTTIIFPANNDSWIVGAASRSYYNDLLEAGVKIFEYVGGLLHTKSLTIDGDLTLIGSANMDRRSFELNYENNILFYNQSLTADMIERQESYIAQSRLLDKTMVESWSWQRRLWNNTIAMLGPVL
jgi:cardiolipin synthase